MAMPIPRISKHISTRPLKNFLCQHPGCDRPFQSHAAWAKYCHEHASQYWQDQRKLDRDRRYHRLKKYAHVNQQIDTSSLVGTKHIICFCETCGEPFNVVLFRNVTVYPKHCPMHRTEYKRWWYARQKAA